MSLKTKLISLLFVAGSLLPCLCIAQSHTIPRGAAVNFGWNQEAIDHIDARAAEMERLYSLVILRKDTLIYERYFNDFQENDVSNIKSGSKSILNILLGIALEHGHIASIEDPIADYIPEYFHDTTASAKRDITIKHLMRMQSGLKPTSLSNYAPWVASEDWIKYALEQPLEAAPGTLYGYSTGDTHLLGVVLAKAVGMSALEYAQENLFEPMDITVDRWTADPLGFHEGGNNIFIKPVDYAKIGIMVRNEGVYHEKQIVSANWLEESTSFQVKPQGISRPFPIDGYGHLWWLVSAKGYKTYSAIGFGGQYMMTIPELDIIIVLTSQYKGSAPGSHFQSIADVIESYILAPFPEK